MGRRKTYDRDDVAARAMDVFWQHGYEATTIEALEKALGVNRYSLFAEFGSKLGLFEAALDVYESTVVATNLGPLEADGASVDDVVAFLEGFAHHPDESARAGCMLCNAAVERSPGAPAVQERAVRYFERLRAAFLHALGSDREDGAVEASAAMLASAVVGAFVQARGGATREQRMSTLQGLVHWVRSHQPARTVPPVR